MAKEAEVSSFNPSYYEGMSLHGANNFFIARMDFIFGLKLLLSDTFDILSKHDHRATTSFSFFDFGDFPF